VNSDSGQDETTSLQCTQTVINVCVTSISQNSASRILFPAVTRKILYQLSRLSHNLFWRRRLTEFFFGDGGGLGV